MSWAESLDGHEIEILQECGRPTRASWPPREMVSWTPATSPSLWNYPSAVIFQKAPNPLVGPYFFLHEFCYATSWFSLFIMVFARLLVRRSWSGLQVLPGTSVFGLVAATTVHNGSDFSLPALATGKWWNMGMLQCHGHSIGPPIGKQTSQGCSNCPILRV
jgi:hypothetical protein